MGTLDGKVAFITGAARGQGRAHAVRLAQDGANIIGIDICEQMSAVGYAMGTQDELDQTVKEVEALGRRMVGLKADVRDYQQVRAAYKEGVEELGLATIVVANAGIGPGGTAVPQDTQWDEVIGVNLTGVWHTGRATIEKMIKNGQGGSVIITSSTGGLMSPGVNDAGMLGYVSAKHGVIGLMRAWTMNKQQGYYPRPVRGGLRLRFALLSLASRIVPARRIFGLYERLVSHGQAREDGYVGNLYGLYGRREVVDAAVFGAGRWVRFEGSRFRAPAEAERYLEIVYGDFRRLPPPELRHSGHRIRAVALG